VKSLRSADFGVVVMLQRVIGIIEVFGWHVGCIEVLAEGDTVQ